MIELDLRTFRAASEQVDWVTELGAALGGEETITLGLVAGATAGVSAGGRLPGVLCAGVVCAGRGAQQERTQYTTLAASTAEPLGTRAWVWVRRSTPQKDRLCNPHTHTPTHPLPVHP